MIHFSIQQVKLPGIPIFDPFFNPACQSSWSARTSIHLIAKTEPAKLGFRAQSKFKFSRRPLFFVTSRVKLVYVRLDKFANFSRSFTRPKLLRLTCPTDFYLDHFYSDQVGCFSRLTLRPLKSALLPL